MIKVYSTSICPKCVMVKNMLNAKGIPFTEHNVEQDGVLEELISEGVNISSVPIINKDGKYYYSIDEITKAISLGDK